MLSKETEDKLKVLGIDVSKLTDAIKAENEVSLEVPALFTEQQKNDYGKNRFDEGKTAMSEILAKDVKKAFKIESESKDINEVIKVFGEMKVKEFGKPNEKIEALEKEKTELQTKLSEALNLTQKTESEFANKLFAVETRTNILSLIPENTTIPKEDIMTLFLATHNIKKDNGRTVVERDGQILKDNVLNPLEVKTIINTFVDSKGFIKKDGMNGKDRTGGGSAKFSNMAEFMDYCKKNEIEPMGNEGQSLLKTNKTDNFNYKS